MNAAKKVATTTANKPNTNSDRLEEYDAVKPNGDVVRVKRNVETGATEIVGK